MSKATGVFLILAGIGTAALLLPVVDEAAELQLTQVVLIATGDGGRSSDPTSAPATEGNQLAPKLRVVATAAPRAVVGSHGPSVPPLRAGIAAINIELSAAPVLITPPLFITKNAGNSGAQRDDVQAREVLARDIQRELKRIGCYEGEVSGEWSSGTRRAMKSFIDRVNAALPTDEPDHILRTMVQGHPGNACVRANPSVMAQNASSKVAVARDIATARPTVPKPTWETTIATRPSEPFSPEGRMAMGGPVQPVLSNAGSMVVAKLPTDDAPIVNSAAVKGLAYGGSGLEETDKQASISMPAAAKQAVVSQNDRASVRTERPRQAAVRREFSSPPSRYFAPAPRARIDLRTSSGVKTFWANQRSNGM